MSLGELGHAGVILRHFGQHRGKRQGSWYSYAVVHEVVDWALPRAVFACIAVGRQPDARLASAGLKNNAPFRR